MLPKTAFILGAGLGTRLRPLTENCPKPLLPVAGKPLICHTMEQLISVGVERFIINTHHAAEVYSKVFPKSNYLERPITFVHEPILLDTGGGLKNIEPQLQCKDDNFWVYNGDIFSNLDLKKIAENHIKNSPLATLLLRDNKSGNVNFDISTGTVCDLRDRLGNAGTTRCQFTGIYLVSKKFLSEIPAGKIESVVEAFLRVIARGNGEIRGVLDNTGFWSDIGTFPVYNELLRTFPQKA